MTIPTKFRDELLKFAESFASPSKKTATLAQTHASCGKAGRLSQVVPEARPFTTALFAALSASLHSSRQKNREAPPFKVAASRYRMAARWLVALLQDKTFQLEHTYHLHRVLLPISTASVEFDASPWGGGALLTRDGVVQ